MKSHHVLSRCAVIGALALAATAADVGGQNNLPTPVQPEVRTSASAERSLEPDLAIITVRFASIGTTPLVAGRFVAARADSLRRAFQALGVPRDSIVTGSRRGWPWEQTSRVDVVVGPSLRAPDGSYRIDTTFRVREALAVRVRDLSKVGAVIDSAFAHGVIDIPPISFVAASAAYSAGMNTGAGTIVVGPQIRITVTVTGRWELTDGQ